MPKDDINYSFTENGVVYDFYDVFVPAVYFRQPQLWGWGYNFYGELGVNNTTQRNTPVTTLSGGTNWKSIACGNSVTIALKTDGSLWLWGYNVFGQLGVNDTTTRRTPITTILGGNDWKSVAGATYHTSAIKTDGSLWLWGYNGFGSLGVNDTTDRRTPITTILGGNDWKSVAGGNAHTIALKTDGSLWLWGLNSSGQLGVNNNVARSTPVTTILGGTNWKSITSIQGDYTIALKTDDSLWLWGNNSRGQLGVNDTVRRSTPSTTILGGNDWKSVAGATSHTIALKTDGSLWLWGYNVFGQLGINDTTDRSTPVTTILGGNDWKSVAGRGDYHTAALKTDGTLWTWGRNIYGQLGVNDTTDRSIPVTTILGGNNWKSVAIGDSHIIAIQYTSDP